VKVGNASTKSIQVAMSPPVTQVDFQVPEKGYLVFSGLNLPPWAWTAIVAGATAATIGGAIAATKGTGL